MDPQSRHVSGACGADAQAAMQEEGRGRRQAPKPTWPRPTPRRTCPPCSRRLQTRRGAAPDASGTPAQQTCGWGGGGAAWCAEASASRARGRAPHTWLMILPDHAPTTQDHGPCPCWTVQIASGAACSCCISPPASPPPPAHLIVQAQGASVLAAEHKGHAELLALFGNHLWKVGGAQNQSAGPPISLSQSPTPYPAPRLPLETSTHHPWTRHGHASCSPPQGNPLPTQCTLKASFSSSRAVVGMTMEKRPAWPGTAG